MKTLGIILIAAGILMMVLREVTITKKEKIVDVGPLEINKKEKESVPWPLYAGAFTTVAGIVVLLVAQRKKI